MDCFTRKAFEAEGNDLCAYLVALAALQSGLQVTFIRDPHAVPGHSAFAFDYTGSVMTIGDANCTHVFNRTRGALTSAEATAVMADKSATKEVLRAHGVSCPRGVRISRQEALEDAQLFQRLDMPLCVVKPLTGSRGTGVSLNIDSQAALTAALQSLPPSVRDLVIEEFVPGSEARYFVADRRVVAVTQRVPPNVIGDGRTTISKLVRIKNESRARNPHLASRPIRLDSVATRELQRQGIPSLDYIPLADEQVVLGGAANMSGGGDSIDASDTASEQAKRIAVAAVQAIGAPNGGVDIISQQSGSEERHHVIEVNSRAQIGSHSFPMIGPGQRNRAAEAVVKSYFPHSEVKYPHVYFSFARVQRVLKRGWASAVALPSLEGKVHDAFAASLQRRLGARQLGVFRDEFRRNGCLGRVRLEGETLLVVDAIGEPASLRSLRMAVAARLDQPSMLARSPSDCDAAISVLDLHYDPMLDCSVSNLKRSVKRVMQSLLSRPKPRVWQR